jgi:menaquinol-cytochrome c reductase iron-sulfur subunit
MTERAGSGDQEDQAERAPDAGAEARSGRRALSLAVIAGGCAVLAGAAIPAVVFVAAPLTAPGAGGVWVKTLRLDQLREREPRRVALVADRRDAWTREQDVQLGSVWLVREGDAVVAFSAVCPHLGCSVDRAPGGREGFTCPCHASAFDLDGARQSGPSPRGLDVLASRLEDGVVHVELKRFRIGLAEKVEA